MYDDEEPKPKKTKTISETAICTHCLKERTLFIEHTSFKRLKLCSYCVYELHDELINHFLDEDIIQDNWVDRTYHREYNR